MNENIDLTKILKDCPIGTEFYHAGYGKVWFCGINLNNNYPILLSFDSNKINTFGVTSKGTVNNTLVNVTSGRVSNVFGGNNIGGTVGTSVVNYSGATISGDIYGGGREADVTGSATVTVPKITESAKYAKVTTNGDTFVKSYPGAFIGLGASF